MIILTQKLCCVFAEIAAVWSGDGNTVRLYMIICLILIQWIVKYMYNIFFCENYNQHPVKRKKKICSLKFGHVVSERCECQHKQTNTHHNTSHLPESISQQCSCWCTKNSDGQITSYSVFWTQLHASSLAHGSLTVAWVRYCTMNLIGLMSPTRVFFKLAV